MVMRSQGTTYYFITIITCAVTNVVSTHYYRQKVEHCIMWLPTCGKS